MEPVKGNIIFCCILFFAIFVIQPMIGLNGLKGQGIMITTEDVKCHGENNGKATVTGGRAPQPYTYNWSHNPAATGSSVEDLPKGSHSVTVTDDGGCTAMLNFEIDEPERLVTTLKFEYPEHNFCDGSFCITVRAHATGGTPPYSWPGGRQRRVCSPGPVFFLTIDDNGCTDPAMTSFAEANSTCRGSVDPNDIVGPTGYDDLQWMSINDRLHYMVRFENDPVLATGPAQYVEVRHDLDPHINPLSVRLGDFGFGEYIFDVPDNVSFYQKRLDLVDDLGIYLDVIGGLDPVSNQVFWMLETIDPATGLRPIDLTVGFLPPNDTLVNDGQGFVNFSVLPKSSTQTRDTAEAEAIIIFDNNEPIPTNIWNNTIDALPPASTMDPLPDTLVSTQIPLSWQGQDDALGSGVANYTLWVSVNGGSFSIAGQDIASTQFTYQGAPGSTYDFYVIAKDNTGNKEIPSGTEASTFILPTPDIQLLEPLSGNLCTGEIMVIDWTSVLVDTVDILLSVDSGENFMPLFNAVLSTDTPFNWPIPDTLQVDFAMIKLTQTNGGVIEEGPFFGIRSLPNVVASADVTICDNEATNLIATGANSYIWTPNYLLNQPDNFITLAFPDTSIRYYVTGTNVFGCMNIDSVDVTVNQRARDSILIEICVGDSVFVGGSWQYTTGFYMDIFQMPEECDSLFITDLQVYNPCIWSGGDIVYVDWTATGNNDGTSWEDAFTSLSYALFYSNLFDNIREVWVAEGTYKPGEGLDREISFVFEDSTRLFGGFAGTESMKGERDHQLNPVYLSGDIGVAMDSSDNIRHVVTIDSTCIDCALDGLTIQWGYSLGLSNPDDRGAGLYSKGTAQLRNVTVEHNQASIGAALTHRGSGSQLIVEDCIIRLNISDLSRDVINIEGAILEFKGDNILKD